MIRDITIGQYYPADSVLHKMDPRAKLVGTLVFIISVFVFHTFPGYAVATIFLAAMIILSKVPVKFMFKGLKAIVMLLMITVVFNIFLTPGKVLWQWGILHVTEEGLKLAGRMAIRLTYLVIGSSLMTLTTTPNQLTDGLERLLRPLNKLHVPIHEIAMMMSIALRFIPILMEETDKIMKAQIARGADFETGNIIQKAKNMIPLLVPLFISAFRRANDLAMAMEARCYHGGDNRTQMKPLTYKKRDHVAYVVLVAYLAVAILAVADDELAAKLDSFRADTAAAVAKKDAAIAAQDYEKAAQLRDIEKNYQEQVEIERDNWRKQLAQNRGNVTADDVAKVVAGWTGIPVTRLTEDESQRLLKLGITNVLNTACPTMWGLTDDKCAQIPTHKAERVVTTLTDYRSSPEQDAQMLTMLQKHYREVYVWLQAVEDYACLRQMDAHVTQNLHLIQPNLRDYTALLASGGIDYVGTRLHGGIHAMNMGCRSLILAVDNRASEIAKDTNLPVLPRGGNLDVLEERICSAWETQIDLPTTAIRQWKNQFRETDAEKVP